MIGGLNVNEIFSYLFTILIQFIKDITLINGIIVSKKEFCIYRNTYTYTLTHTNIYIHNGSFVF